MEIRTLLAFGTGIGIEIRSQDLAVTMTRVRPSGVKILGSTVIQNFRERPASEWGAEYGRFLRAHGGTHLAATVVVPRREVIVRQLPLAGVANKEIAAAVGFQLDTLHPYGDDDVSCGWEPISRNGTVLIGVIRTSVLVSYIEKFAEAGVAAASFTFSAAAYHGAARLLTEPPAQGFVALRFDEHGEIEIYGESPSRPVFSAQLDLPAERATALAAAELRLPADTVALRFDQVLPPVKEAALKDFDFSRSALPYAASLAGACPRLARAANLLPEENRKTNSRVIFVPTAILAALLLLVAGAVFGYSAFEEKRYVAVLRKEIAQREPQARKAVALDKDAEAARSRTRLLDEFRSRSKSDLDALNELTKLLVPPSWTNTIDISRDSIILAGEADQAAPLLKLIDSSPYFRDSSFAIPIVRTPTTEMFRVRAARRPR